MFDHVLAVVAVRDIVVADAWYTKLFDRQAKNNPMPTLVEWQVTDSAWVQVTVDSDRAGSSLLNFAAPDLDSFVAAARSRGLAFGDPVEANNGVRLSAISDPDGNTITAIGGFRVTYQQDL